MVSRLTVCLALLAVSLLLFSSNVRASGLAEGLEEPLNEQESKTALERLKELQQDLDSFSARAMQTKRLSMLSEEINTEGHVLLKRPNFMRWETVIPERIIATADGKSMIIYHVDLKRARRLDLSTDFSARHTMRFFSSVMASSFDGFSKDFRLSVYKSPGSIVVDLKPKSSMWARYLGGMTIWFDTDSGVPSKFVVDWKKRGEIETVFDNIKVNPVVEGGAFDAKLPDYVVVIEPDLADDFDEME